MTIKQLKQLEKLASKNDPVYKVNYRAIELNTITATALDGYILVQINHGLDMSDTKLLETGEAKYIRSKDTDSLTIEDVQTLKAKDVSYPDYQKAIPTFDESTHEHISIDAKKLIEALEFFKTKPNNKVEIYFKKSTPNAPMILQNHDTQAIVMPLTRKQ